MNITDIKVDIKNKAIKPYYIFTGDEIEVQRIYVNKIAEVVNKPVMRVEQIADVWDSIITPSLFGDSYVYVVRDDLAFIQDEHLQQILDSGELNGNIIILLLSSVDKRTKWYKANSGRIAVFEHLSSSVLSKYIQREIPLNNLNTERLIAICENDYSRILLEIDKIKSFIAFLPECDCNKTFEAFVEDGTIFIPPSDMIFALIDAILTKQMTVAYDLLAECKAVGTSTMAILVNLHNATKQVYQVQTCDSSDVSRSTGLSAWQIKKAKEKCGYYDNAELVSIIRLVQRVQKEIVMGILDEPIAVEYLMAVIFGAYI